MSNRSSINASALSSSKKSKSSKKSRSESIHSDSIVTLVFLLHTLQLIITYTQCSSVKIFLDPHFGHTLFLIFIQKVSPLPALSQYEIMVDLDSFIMNLLGLWILMIEFQMMRKSKRNHRISLRQLFMLMKFCFY